jgi:hypothetical protein
MLVMLGDSWESRDDIWLALGMECLRLSRAVPLRLVGQQRRPLSVRKGASTVLFLLPVCNAGRRRRLPTPSQAASRQSRPGAPIRLKAIQTDKEKSMPVILWLLGVPLGVVILLMLLHVI